MSLRAIRRWRVSRAGPKGVQLWFDPAVEGVSLHPVPQHELAEAADAALPHDMMESGGDDSVSVGECAGSVRAVSRSTQLELFEEYEELAS